ncbi:MAG: hypothetical protein RSD36_11775 [Terrisporobacter sp.]
MDRTYDIFVDNGLFILSYYLKKEIKDITMEEIEDSVAFMSGKVEEYLECEKYSNLKSMVLFNSTVSNPSLKNVKLETHLQEFVKNKGNDYCMICGQNHANLKFSLKGRSYLPNRPSATYFNFSNNLHNINVCPYCLLLTTYSVMNCRVDNYVYLYNSSDDEFMKEITVIRQEENEQDILLKAEKSKINKSRFDLLEEMLDHNVNFSSQVEIHKFNNGKSEDIVNSDKIYSKNIKLMRKMRNKSLLSEFKSLNLSWMIVENKLQSNYLGYIYDFEKDNLKCTKELFDFLNKEVNMLDDKIITLIDRITNNLVYADLDIGKIRNKIKAVKGIKDFDNIIMEIQEMYYEKTKEALFNKNEYNEMINIRKYNAIKNMMLLDLI